MSFGDGGMNCFWTKLMSSGSSWSRTNGPKKQNKNKVSFAWPLLYLVINIQINIIMYTIYTVYSEKLYL
jgi:hypothetical protein